ncbi:MAG: Ada metal-binding domain-containing protein [Alphaproteobacteria bacterium]|nr:Ada metal-binding domain-containing protein [Alphaproteobacteria bacterium]
MLDFPTCLKAMRQRDAAFDGVFFIGVRTTGIYCRPVCRVKTPMEKNVTFHPSAAAAEQAGFRPCLRCRPETAPFSPAWNGTRTTADRAMRLIAQGALNNGSVEELADRLGIGARHLSRLLQEHIGASPKQIAQTLRIHKAKRLLDQTDLSMADIAVEAGFGSTRRFNAAFNKLYGRAPSSFRKKKPASRQAARSRRSALLDQISAPVV